MKENAYTVDICILGCLCDVFEDSLNFAQAEYEIISRDCINNSVFYTFKFNCISDIKHVMDLFHNSCGFVV